MRCPRCGHADHYGKSCYNMASDNDCNCKFGEASLIRTITIPGLHPETWRNISRWLEDNRVYFVTEEYE